MLKTRYIIYFLIVNNQNIFKNKPGKVVFFLSSFLIILLYKKTTNYLYAKWFRPLGVFPRSKPSLIVYVLIKQAQQLLQLLLKIF